MIFQNYSAFGIIRTTGLLLFALPSVQAQTPDTERVTIRFPLKPWVLLVESLDGVINGLTSCEDQYGVYVGAVKNGVPDGPGKITMECEAIPIGIGADHVPETCIDCSIAQEWLGVFHNGELPFGTIALADGSKYEGPLFNLVPHGEGTVTPPEAKPFRQTFRFGWPVQRLSPQSAVPNDDSNEEPTE